MNIKTIFVVITLFFSIINNTFAKEPKSLGISDISNKLLIGLSVIDKNKKSYYSKYGFNFSQSCIDGDYGRKDMIVDSLNNKVYIGLYIGSNGFYNQSEEIKWKNDNRTTVLNIIGVENLGNKTIIRAKPKHDINRTESFSFYITFIQVEEGVFSVALTDEIGDASADIFYYDHNLGESVLDNYVTGMYTTIKKAKLFYETDCGDYQG